jgi:hypothetical protein
MCQKSCFYFAIYTHCWWKIEKWIVRMTKMAYHSDSVWGRGSNQNWKRVMKWMKVNEDSFEKQSFYFLRNRDNLQIIHQNLVGHDIFNIMVDCFGWKVM